MNLIGQDKIPPQAVEIEAAVLGRALNDTSSADKVVDILFNSSFHNTAHAVVYDAIAKLLLAGNPVELISVTDELKRVGKLEEIGGAHFMYQLSNNAASSPQIEYYCRIIEQKRILRDLIHLSTKTAQACFDPDTDPFEVHSAIETGLESVMKLGGSNEKSLIDVLIEVKESADAGAGHDGITGMITGMPELDQLFGGRQKGHLIIWGGRPGMGKSGKMISEALAVAATGNDVAIFSLEMTAKEVVQRMIAQVAEIDIRRISRGGMSEAEWGRFHTAFALIEKMPIHIFDDIRTLSAILTKIRMLKRKCDLKMVYIDHLGWVKTPGFEGRTDERLGEISMSLKSCAKSHDLAIVLLVQLNRNVETRGGDKRPSLGDLKNSGNLEEDADVVEFIYRAEYYGITHYEDGGSTNGIAEIIVAKNRGGTVDTIRVQFIAYLTKFADINWSSSVFVGKSDTVLSPNTEFEDSDEPF